MKKLVLLISLAAAFFASVSFAAQPFFFGTNAPAATSSSKTPDQVTGLLAWYKFNTLAGSDSSAVTSYTDASGNGNNIGGTATLRTGANGKNSLNVLQFNGTSEELFLNPISGNPNAQPYSIFIVFQALSTTSGPVVIYWGTGCELQIDNGGSNWDPQAGNGTDRSIGSTADTNWHVMGFVFNGASSKWRIDGGAWTTFATDPGSNALTRVSLASVQGSAFLNCKIAEVALYNTGVTTTVGGDGDLLFAGFNIKWTVY